MNDRGTGTAFAAKRESNRRRPPRMTEEDQVQSRIRQKTHRSSWQAPVAKVLFEMPKTFRSQARTGANTETKVVRP